MYTSRSALEHGEERNVSRKDCLSISMLNRHRSAARTLRGVVGGVPPGRDRWLCRSAAARGGPPSVGERWTRRGGMGGSLEMPRQRERMSIGGGDLALLSNETRILSGLLRQAPPPSPAPLLGERLSCLAVAPAAAPLALVMAPLWMPMPVPHCLRSSVPVSNKFGKSSGPAPELGVRRVRLRAGVRPANSLGDIIILKGVTSQAAEVFDGLRPAGLLLLPLLCMRWSRGRRWGWHSNKLNVRRFKNEDSPVPRSAEQLRCPGGRAMLTRNACVLVRHQSCQIDVKRQAANNSRKPACCLP